MQKLEPVIFEPSTPADPTPAELLATAKYQKFSELVQWTVEQTAALEWQGATYQTNQLARDRLMASLTMHQLGIRPNPSPWRTLDNTMVNLSGEALTALCAAVYLRHQEVTLASFEFKDQIEALTTIEAVQGFTFVI